MEPGGLRRSLYRDDLNDGDKKVKGQGPTEDEHGNRHHSKAGQAINNTFGGLALGFSGGPNTEDIPDESTYGSLLFKPGTNLGPAYPDDLRMTSTCAPILVRKGHGRPRGPQMTATFSPPLPANVQKKIPGNPPPTAHKWNPCVDWSPECPGEGAGEPNVMYDASNRMFLFFGPPESQQRPPFCPPEVETTEEAVYDYFEGHNIEELMEYLLTLLCIHLPDDPFEYIQDTCEQMIKCRGDKTEMEKLDVVFEPNHLLAMFSLFDKQQQKFISLEQYKAAMEMLGIARYNPTPIGHNEGMITEDVFFEETSKAMSLLLKSFIG